MNIHLLSDGDGLTLPPGDHPREDQLQGPWRQALMEYAGRICYDSLGQGRNSADYHAHIKEVSHTSVYAHCPVVLDIDVDASVCANRPGVRWSPGRVVVNHRACLEWDRWSRILGVDGKEAGDVIRAGMCSTAPMVLDPVACPPAPLLEPVSADECWVSLRLGMSRGCCYDSETEVLTRDGWKKWPDVTGDEEFATLNMSTQELEYQQASMVSHEPHHGPMYRVHSQAVSLMVTPNHRMVVRLHDTQAAKRGEETFRILTAEDVHGRRLHYKRTADWVGESPAFFDLDDVAVRSRLRNNQGTRTITCKGKRIDAMAFARFMGYWLAEGHLQHGPGTGYTTCLTQNHGGRAWVGMLDVLTRMGFTYRIQGNKLNACKCIRVNGGKVLYDFLLPFNGSANKGIPPALKNWAPEYQRELIEAYLEGDGSFSTGGSGEGHTVSSRLADDLQEAALKAGWSASIRVVDRRDEPARAGRWAKIRHRRVAYVVGFAKLRNLEPLVNHGGKTHDAWEHYSGMVHCVTVPNGTLYVRRDGKPCWSGNSHELVRHHWDMAISQRSSRFCDESESEWVMHPVLEGFLDARPPGGAEEDRFLINRVITAARGLYVSMVDHLGPHLAGNGVDKASARKQARGAARQFLGNGLATEMVMSCSVRQLINIMAQRGGMSADAEIRRLVVDGILPLMVGSRYTHWFGGILTEPAPGGIGSCIVPGTMPTDGIRPVMIPGVPPGMLWRGPQPMAGEIPRDVRSVVSLRMSAPLGDDPRHVHCPIPFRHDSLEGFYTDPGPDVMETIRRAAIAVIGGMYKGPVLVHCRHGLDRTGVVVAVVALSRGAKWEDIMTDHCRSIGVGLDRLAFMRRAMGWINAIVATVPSFRTAP